MADDVEETDPKILEAMEYLKEHLPRGTNPALEAEMIDRLMKAGWSQQKIAEAIGRSQSQVSKRALLLKLIPSLFKRLKDGTLLPSAARDIAKLPRSKQKKFIKMEDITIKLAMEGKRLHNLGSLDFSVVELPPNPLEPDPVNELSVLAGQLQKVSSQFDFDLQDKTNILTTAGILQRRANAQR